jgi:phage terminase small subunit
MTILTNAKHEAVALAYLADPEKIGWRAYRKVYPKSSRHTAENCFSRLMKKEEFAARVAELHEQAAQAAVMTAQEVLEELTKLGRANMADYIQVGPNGDPILNLRGLNRSQGAALVEVTVEDFKDGRGADARDVRRVRFKLADKRGALNLLGKHHALFTERHVHEVNNIGARLTAALARLNQQSDDEDRHES